MFLVSVLTFLCVEASLSPAPAPAPARGRRAASIPAYSGTATYALDKECDGLDGTCAMGACTTRSTAATCQLNVETFTASQEVGKYRCQTCTQTPAATDERCSTKFLSEVLKSAAGVQAAYCNDKNLVILTDGSPSHTPDLDKVVIPPSGAGGCVTRTWSPKMKHFKVPVLGKYTLLATASRDNNANTNSFPNGPGKDGYLSSDTNGVYGLPQSGPTGVTTAGEEVFPVFSDQVVLTPESCEVDSCQEHVGQGGGSPHLHGDPFSKTAGKCLYSPADYANVTAHPPLVGFSLDGPSIYGRYLSTSAPGYSTALDDCGGHLHDAYQYHYHASVKAAAATSRNKAKAVTGTEFPAFPFGPDQCYKADISKTTGFWENGNAPSQYTQPCCGMTEYWVKAGITINGQGTQNLAGASTTATGSGSSTSTGAATTGTTSTGTTGATTGTTGTTAESKTTGTTGTTGASKTTGTTGTSGTMGTTGTTGTTGESKTTGTTGTTGEGKTTGTTGTTGESKATGTTGHDHGGHDTTGATSTIGGSKTIGTTGTTGGVTPAAKPLVVTGDVGLNVPDADAFMADDAAKGAVKAGIADSMGVAKEQVAVVFKKGRRLSEERHLAGTSVTVAYTITLPASFGAAVHAAAQAKASAATKFTLTSAISAQVTAAKGNSYTVSVASMSTPAGAGGDPMLSTDSPSSTSSSAAIKAGVAFLMLAFFV